MESIKTTLGKLVAAGEALKRLSEKSLTPKIAYHVAKLARLAGPEIVSFQDRRIVLAKELGEAADDKGSWTVRPENVSVFNERIKELADIEVTLAYGPLDLEPLGNITPADIIALGDLLKEPA